MYSERFITCISCPLGCSILVELNAGGKVASASGNRCKRGEAYVVKELTNPERTLTAVVALEGCLEPLSVKTVRPIPKDKIYSVLSQVRQLKLTVPVTAGDVLIEDVCQTGVSVVATKTLP